MPITKRQFVDLKPGMKIRDGLQRIWEVTSVTSNDPACADVPGPVCVNVKCGKMFAELGWTDSFGMVDDQFAVDVALNHTKADIVAA